TDDQIEDIVPDDVISDETKLLLANAIYFSSGWQYPFNKDDSGSDAFHLTDGSTVDVPFMTQEHGFAYAETDHAQVIDLPYNADSFNLTIILPDEGQFDAVEKALDADTWQSMIDALKQSNTQLSLPTFA